MSIGDVIKFLDAGLKLWPYFVGASIVIGTTIYYFAPRNLVNKLQCVQEAQSDQAKSNAALQIATLQSVDSYKQETGLLRMRGMLGKLERNIERELGGGQAELDLSEIEDEIDVMLNQLVKERDGIKKLIQDIEEKADLAAAILKDCGEVKQ